MKLNEITNDDVYGWLKKYRKFSSSDVTVKNGRVELISLYLAPLKNDGKFIPPPVEFDITTNCRLSFFDINSITLDWLRTYKNLTIAGHGDFGKLIPEINKSVHKVDPMSIAIHTLETSTLNIPDLCGLPCDAVISAFKKVKTEYEDLSFMLIKNADLIRIMVYSSDGDVRDVQGLNPFSVQDWLIDNDYQNFI